MKEYLPRIADEQLKRKLAVGVVLIKGAKWCGKTRTAEQQAKSELLMDDPEKREQNIALAKNSPSVALEGATPRLIDEWQMVPKLWDAVRFEVDRRGEGGQFILTGSAVPPDMSDVHHTGTGRVVGLLMRPMSLYESGDSTGEVSLSELFDAPERIGGNGKLDLKDIAFLTCRGGWPKVVKMERGAALTLAEAYYDGVINSDISRVDGVKRSSAIAGRIMRSYARFQGQQISLEQIRSDAEAMDGIPLSIDTVYDYVDALRKIYVIEDCSAWNPNLRSKASIRTSDTRYFVDPSIATQALEARPDDLIQDLNTFGFIFETLCMRDLRVYAEAIRKKVSHYRDSNGLECDAVIHSNDGGYGLVQIKLGSDDESIQDGVDKLKALRDTIDVSKMAAPSFMMVLSGNCPYAYKREEDGVYVVPVGCLKP